MKRGKGDKLKRRPRPHASPIFGIACEVENESLRGALLKVLTAIRRHPHDWRRLRRRVSAFGWYQGADSTMGEFDTTEECRRLHVLANSIGDWERKVRALDRADDARHLAAGKILVPRRLALSRHAVAVIAHECGHAVARKAEVERRATGGMFADEWASELTADFHAWSWGFERELRAWAPSRSISHHAGLPGDTLTQEFPDGPRHFRVDSRFYPRPVSDAGGGAR